MDYRDIDPKKPTNGTIVTIDSTQWRTVLIQEGNKRIFIAEPSGEIKEIALIDESEHGLVAFLIVFCIVILIIGLSTSRY